MYLAKELTQKSLPEIGELFGGRDHTTVLHAVRKISAERQTNTELNQQLHVLEQNPQGLAPSRFAAPAEHGKITPFYLTTPIEADMILFKTTQDKVLAVLQSVCGIVERRHTMPILANVLLHKVGNAVQLTTSDLEIQIRTTAELGGDEGDFATTIGARKLMDILKTMPADQTVTLEANADKICSKAAKAALPCSRCPRQTSRWCKRPPALAPPSACRKKRSKT